MGIGNQHMMVVEAIAEAERGTTGEIRVHISNRRFDFHPMKRARQIFMRYEMENTEHRNAVLLYVNPRRRQFAVYGDVGIHTAVGQQHWDELAKNLRADLASTDFENAIARCVRALGKTLAIEYPAAPGEANPDELSNEVTED